MNTVPHDAVVYLHEGGGCVEAAQISSLHFA